eukprot:365736-Chlamydomonas_euryale.AAC.12
MSRIASSRACAKSNVGRAAGSSARHSVPSAAHAASARSRRSGCAAPAPAASAAAGSCASSLYENSPG